MKTDDENPVVSDTITSASLRSRYLQVLRSFCGCDRNVLLYLSSLPNPIQARLDCWCPADVLHKVTGHSEPGTVEGGAICVRDLQTPIGLVRQARVRESDVIALELVVIDTNRAEQHA